MRSTVERKLRPERPNHTRGLMAYGLVSVLTHGGVLAFGQAEDIARAVRRELVSAQDERSLLVASRELVEQGKKISNVFEFVATAALLEQGHSRQEVAAARAKHARVVQTGLRYKMSGEPLITTLDFVLSEQGEYEEGQRSVIDLYNKERGNCDARLQKIVSELAEIFPEYYALNWIQGQTFNGLDGDGDGRYDTPGVDTEPHVRVTLQVDENHHYIVEGDHARLEAILPVGERPTTVEASTLLVSSYLANHATYTHGSSLKGRDPNTGPRAVFTYPGSPVVYQPQLAEAAIQLDLVTATTDRETQKPFILDEASYRPGQVDWSTVTAIDAALLLELMLHPERDDDARPADLTVQSAELTRELLDGLRSPDSKVDKKTIKDFIQKYFVIKDPHLIRDLDRQLMGPESFWTWDLPIDSPGVAAEVASFNRIVELQNTIGVSTAAALAHGKVYAIRTSQDFSPAVLETLLTGSIKEIEYHATMTDELAEVLRAHPLELLSLSRGPMLSDSTARSLAAGQFGLLRVYGPMEANAMAALLSSHTIASLELFGSGLDYHQTVADALPVDGIVRLVINKDFLNVPHIAERLNNSSIQELTVISYRKQDWSGPLPQIEQLAIPQLNVSMLLSRDKDTERWLMALGQSRVQSVNFGFRKDETQAWIRQYVPQATFESSDD